jgi:hypothetical protein
MNTPKKRSPALLVAGLVVFAVVVVAFLKQDAIAGMILKGGDTSLIGEAAQSSPQAQLAVDFLSALRTSDVATMERLATAEQAARIRQESATPSPEYQEMTAMMLEDLPADASELRGRIKSVQVHKQRGVVTFETRANSWFVTMDLVDGGWRVAAF